MSKNGKKEKKFLSIGDAESFTGLGQGRLREFYKEGILKGYTTPSGQRRFDIEHLREFCNITSKSEVKEIKKVNYLYARVSSKKQSDDLSRQVAFLHEWARDKDSEYVVIEDIGSGINFKRKGLNDILDRSLHGLIGEVVVAHKDRLSRFAFDLIESIITKAGGSVTIINDSGNTSSEQELAEDLLSIVHIYSCRQMVIKVNLTPEQNKKMDYDLQVSNYVYNKAVKFINSGVNVSKLTMRDQLVTTDSRKHNVLLNKVNSAKTKIEAIIKDLKKVRSLKSVVKAFMIKEKCWKPIKRLYDAIRYMVPPSRNDTMKDFEMITHKDVRAGSVFEAYTNYLNNCDVVKAGRIKFFQLGYRSKKKNGMSMTLTKAMVKITNGVLRFTAKDLLDKVIRVNNKSRKKLMNITSLKDCKLTKKYGIYHIRIPLDVSIETPESLTNTIGIDPGVSTFLSCYTPDQTITIKQTNRCKGYDWLRARLKAMRKKKERKRIRRRLLAKLDLKKQYLTDELHWKSISYLVKNYDIIFIEKFDSQGFVKNGKSKNLNRNTNNLKPYEFRQRLQYKALTAGKIVEVVKAHNTTKTCSNCGSMKEMTLKDREHDCKTCKQVLDRDFNAAKNMILKGLCC